MCGPPELVMVTTLLAWTPWCDITCHVDRIFQYSSGLPYPQEWKLDHQFSFSFFQILFFFSFWKNSYMWQALMMMFGVDILVLFWQTDILLKNFLAKWHVRKKLVIWHWFTWFEKKCRLKRLVYWIRKSRFKLLISFGTKGLCRLKRLISFGEKGKRRFKQLIS